MTEPDRIRLSDNERERYAQQLRTAFAEGRITDAELEERLQAVYQARFESDIELVTSDLPAPIEPIPVGRPPTESNSIDVGRIARTAVQWYFPALICTAIWAITSFGGYFWPVWVFFGLTIPFLSSLVFDGDPDPDADADDSAADADDSDRAG